MCNNRFLYEIKFSFIVFLVFALCIAVFFVYKIYRRIAFEILSLFFKKIKNNINVAIELINKKKVIVRTMTNFDRAKKKNFDDNTKVNEIKIVKIVKAKKINKRKSINIKFIVFEFFSIVI